MRPHRHHGLLAAAPVRSCALRGTNAHTPSPTSSNALIDRYGLRSNASWNLYCAEENTGAMGMGEIYCVTDTKLVYPSHE